VARGPGDAAPSSLLVRLHRLGFQTVYLRRSLVGRAGGQGLCSGSPCSARVAAFVHAVISSEAAEEAAGMGSLIPPLRPPWVVEDEAAGLRPLGLLEEP
jgi:hypothetical protein